MDPVVLLTILAALIIVVIIGARALTGNYTKVGPNEALIVFGGKERTISGPDGTKVKVGYRIEIGGGTWVNPFTEKGETLSLEVHPLTIETPEVLTKEGVPLTAVGVSQIRIGADEWNVHLAAGNFLGAEPEVIREVAMSIIEGHMRNQMGAMTVEELYQQRFEFTKRVRDAAQIDLSKLGLQLISFSLKDISDSQGYLDALSKPRIAQVKLEAVLAQAEADRDGAIKAAAYRQEGEIARLQADAKIAGASWENEGKKADSMAGVNRKKANADLTYELERHRVNQEVKKEEYKVRMIEKEQAGELEKLEIVRRELELDATVRKPAEARKFQVQAEAEGEAFKMMTESKARAEASRMEGKAEAERVEAIGIAEAGTMTKKAEAYKSYTDAAMVQMVIEKMPELARAIAEPLAKVDRIVMIGDGDKGGPSGLTSQVTKMVSQVPDVVESLTGIDLKKILAKKLGADNE